MSTAEFTYWLAYFRIEEEKRKEQERRDRVMGKLGKRGA